MRGRVMGFYTLVFFGGTPIGAPLLGMLADSAGPRWTLGIGGLCVLVCVIITAIVLRGRLTTVPKPETDDPIAPRIPSVGVPSEA